MKNFLSILYLFTLAFTLNAQTAQDSLTQNLTNLCKQSKVPGFSVAVVSKDKIIYRRGFGYADLKTKKPYTTSTIQNIGSTSKTLIGMAVMQAIQQGKLSLDTPINEVLPFEVTHPKYPDIPITVKQLSSHTAGIEDSRNYYLKSYVPIEMQKEDRKHMSFGQKVMWKMISKTKRMSLEEYLRNYLSAEGAFYKKSNFKNKPGTAYSYTNAGAALAALVVQYAVKMDFKEYCQKHIFDVLEMNETGWTFEDIDMNKHATLYHPKKTAELPRYTLNTYPDGGLLTNMDDLSVWLQNSLKGRIEGNKLLSQKEYETMMTSYVEGLEGVDKGDGYGIFWDIAKGKAAGHGGSDPGANSFMYLFPEQNVGVVFQVNMSLDETKETSKVFGQIWNYLRSYSKTIPASEK